MFLGIDDNSGLIYESAGSIPDRSVYPTPTVSQARLIDKPEDWSSMPTSLRGNAFTWMFREDSYDPVTRTRRGRLYQDMSGASYPQDVRVRPSPSEYPGGGGGSDGRTSKRLFVYAPCTKLLEYPNKGAGLKLAIGNSSSSSAWRIVQVEVTVYDDIMVTLRALTAMGVLPELDLSKVQPEFQPMVTQALDRAVNSAFRETAESVVDQCRNALVVVLSRWMVQKGADERTLSKELGELARAIEVFEMTCTASVAKVVAKLHSRGKMNELKSLRPVTEDDAELAVQMLGFALREVGWAR